jgi:MFS-type transporter involved in bile tolerance (Atg22 family)
MRYGIEAVDFTVFVGCLVFPFLATPLGRRMVLMRGLFITQGRVGFVL